MIQLKVMLHALGYFEADLPEPDLGTPEASVYGLDTAGPAGTLRGEILHGTLKE